MSKKKLNLTQFGTSNEAIINYISDVYENVELAEKLKPFINDTKQLYSIIWDEYDFVFDNTDEQDQINQSIYSNETYIKGSFEYNFMLDYIIKMAQSFTKNGHTPKRTNFR